MSPSDCGKRRYPVQPVAVTRRQAIILGVFALAIPLRVAHSRSFSDQREAAEKAYQHIVSRTPFPGSSSAIDYRDMEGKLRYEILRALTPLSIPAPFPRGEWGALINVQVVERKSDREPYLFAISLVGAGATYAAAYSSGLTKGWQRQKPGANYVAREDLSFFLWVHRDGLNTPIWLTSETPLEVDELKKRFRAAREKLESVTTNDAREVNAKSLGLAAFEQGRWAAEEGVLDESSGLLNIGVALTDIALGLLPGIGLAKDAYEGLTGTHLLTGAELSNTERLLALAGIFALGFGGAITAGIKGTGKILEATSTARKINNTTRRYIKHLEGPASVVTKRSAASVNADFIAQIVKDHPQIVAPQPPWSDSKAVFDFVASRDFTVWRVHKSPIDGINPAAGDWVMRVMPSGLSPADVKELYALPAADPMMLKSISTLKIPKGTALRVGEAGPNTFGSGGMVQWQILDKVKPEWVVETRAFP